MNAYEQLHEIRTELERRDALPETLVLLDRLIAQAEPQRDNSLSISQSMILRHLLGQREVLSNHYMEMDILALAGDLDERRPNRDEDAAPSAATEGDQRPQHLRSFYKKQKEKEKERQKKGS